MTDFAFRQEAIADPPKWATEIITTWDDEYLKYQVLPFIISDYWIDQTSINIFNVIGTWHTDYQGLTWLELLRNGKRMRLNLELYEENPGYYDLTTERPRPSICYVTLDGINYYVYDDGNHRTTIAKFHLHNHNLCMLHGVRVNHYTMDHNFKNLYQEILHEIREQNLNVQLSMNNKTIERRDGPGWKEDRFELALEWSEWPSREKHTFTYEEAQLKLQELKGQRIANEIELAKQQAPNFWKWLTQLIVRK